MSTQQTQQIQKPEPAPTMLLGKRGIEVGTLDEIWRFAGIVLSSKLAPQAFQTKEQIVIAIELGLNLGLAPMQALSTIAVINGRPCLWGDGFIAVVQASPACLWIRETIDGEGEAMTAICETQRRGRPEPTSYTFSIADARRAGLLDKPGPWKQYTRRMLQMRARGFCLRDAYPDVLKGVALAEEIQDYVEVETVASRPLEAPRRLSERPAPQATDIPFGSPSIEQPASASSSAGEASTPQADAPPAGGDEPITEPQLKRLHTIATNAKWSKADLSMFLSERYGYASSKQITKAEYDGIVAHIEANPAGVVQA